jgi:hypothetical protein
MGVRRLLVAGTLAATSAFRTAFWVMFAVAALGALTAAIAFPRRTTRQAGLEPAMSPDSIVPQPEARG